MSNEKPIIFSTEMVQAIIDGRKTETRRVVKPQPEEKMKEDWPDFDGEIYRIDLKTPDGQKLFGFCTAPKMEAGEKFGSMKSKYGNPGDLLYVRESFYLHKQFDKRPPSKIREGAKIWFETNKPLDRSLIGRKRPSIHMPKHHSRIWLRVKEVTVEGVQDITPKGIRAEGVKVLPKETDAIHYHRWNKLWDSINESRGYGIKENPYVWVVKFEVVSTNGRPE